MANTVYKELLLQDLRLDGTLALLGDDAVLKIVRALLAGTRRFGMLQQEIGCSSKTLSGKLKSLMGEGLVSRTLHAEVPPRAEYALTDKGREFAGIIQGILEWERQWE